MQFCVLGTLEVTTGDPPVPLRVPGAMERALLGRLLVRPGSVVTVDSLVEDLWAGLPPRTSRKSLQVHVVRLRSTLEPDRPKGSPGRYVVRRGDGYALAAGPEDVDASMATALAASGRAALSADDPARALALLRRAESLWRGVPFLDWQDAGWSRAARESLTSLRRTVLEARLDAELALGNHQGVVDELEGLVASDPLAEGWAARLMVTLYRSDRQVDALAVGRRARTLLVEELGLEAGLGLRHVEEAILLQSPELDPPAQGTRLPTTSPTLAARAGCPYLGLASYRAEDEVMFHGRAAALRALVARARTAGLVVVSGSSGAGKSSLVRAGLLPALRRGALPGSEGWRPVDLVPGARPVDDLAPLLSEEDDEEPDGVRAPVVLVVDQLEEIWTSGVPPAERTAFLDALLALLDDGVCARVVLVVRGDHLGRLGEHAALTARAADGIVLVPPLTEPELREVVVAPALACGLVVDPDLVDAVLRDVHGQSAALPLLSSALAGTWQRRRDDELTLAGYLEAGGVTGALARSGEDALLALPADARGVARPLLLRLAATSSTGQAVRRRLPMAELDLDGDDGDLRRQVVETFVQRRLLSVDADSLDVTHEALLTGWPRLAGWLAEDAASRAVRTHLTPEARAWDEAGRPEDRLYRGARLSAAQEWASRSDADLAPVERDFVQASLAHGQAELEQARDQARREKAASRRTRRFAAVLAVTVVVTLTAGAMAVQGRREADRSASAARLSAVRAEADRLAAASANASSLDLSLLLAAQAYRTSATPQTEDGLLAAVVGHRQVSGVYRTDGLARRIAVGGQGRTLYAHGEGQVVSWDLRTRAPTVVDSYDSDEAFPTDVDVGGTGGGDVVAVVRPRQPGAPSSTLRVLRPDGSTRWVLGEAELGGWPVVAEFTGDGDELLVDTVRGYGGASPVGQYVLVDTVSGSARPVGPAEPFPQNIYYDPYVKAIAEDAGTATYATVSDELGDRVFALDVATGSSTRMESDGHDTVGSSFAPVVGGVVELAEDSSVYWYPEGSATSTQQLSSHLSRAQAAATDASGRVLVTGGTDRRVVVHDLVDSQWVPREVLTGHTGTIREVAVSPDGRRAFSTGDDRTIIEWDLSDTLRFGTVVRRLQDPVSGAFSIFTGPAVAAGSSGELVAPANSVTSPGPGGKLWGYALFLDADSPHAVLDWVRVGTRPVVHIPFSVAATSPDSRLVAVTAQFSTTVLRTDTHDVVAHVELDEVDGARYGHEGRVPEPVSPATWNHDGSRLLLGTGGEGRTGLDVPGSVVVVDTTSWAVVDRLPAGSAVTALTVSPDRRWLAVGEASGRVAVADARTYEVVHELSTRGSVAALAFSGDSARLAAVGASKALEVWDPATGRELLHEPQRFGGAGTSVAWLPDDRTVVHGGDDGHAVLFDTVRQRVRGVPLPVLRDGGDGVVHVTPPREGSSDLTLLPGPRAGSAVREGMVYPLDVSAWLGHACGVAAREMTSREWVSYLPDRPQAATCSDLRARDE